MPDIRSTHCSSAHVAVALLSMFYRRSVGAVGDGLEVHTRRGVSYKLSDLRKVAAGRASTVIL